jgi:hypothetical protein
MLSASARDRPKVNNENGVSRENIALIGILIFALVWYTYCGGCISAEYQSHDENPTYRTQRLPTISFFPNCIKVAQIHMVVKCR